jgi:hypothetical protein
LPAGSAGGTRFEREQAMNAKTLYSLIAAALVALIAAWWINSAQKPVSESAEQTTALLPGFREQVNDVTAITFTGADHKVLATLKRGSNGWTVAEKSDYPADVVKLREFLLKLADATVLEQKTSNPKHYTDLGVNDVSDKDTNGVLVSLDGLKQPLKLIIGNYNGAGGGGTFVRRDGEAQSLLVKGNLTAEKVIANWEKKDIADIAATRLKQVVLTNPEGKVLKAYKEQAGDANFKVADVPKGREVSSDFVANTLGSTLSSLHVEDAFPAKEVPPGDKVYKASYLTSDGLDVGVVAWVKDSKDYAQFTAALDSAATAANIDADQAKAKADFAAAQSAAGKTATAKAGEGADSKPAVEAAADSVAKAAAEPIAPLAVSDPAKDKAERLKVLNDEVVALNKTFAGWTFVLPSFKFSSIDKSMDDMLKPLEQKKPDAKDAAKPAPGKPAVPAKKN